MNVGKQPNGFVQYIDWDNREVVCFFYDTQWLRGGDNESFEFDDLQWTDHFGGTYMIIETSADYLRERMKLVAEIHKELEIKE